LTFNFDDFVVLFSDTQNLFLMFSTTASCFEALKIVATALDSRVQVHYFMEAK
jgi:hypothetical protein